MGGLQNGGGANGPQGKETHPGSGLRIPVLRPSNSIVAQTYGMSYARVQLAHLASERGPSPQPRKGGNRQVCFDTSLVGESPRHYLTEC